MNRRKFTLLAGLCAATLASGFGNAAVAGKLEDIMARGKLIVGTGLTNQPSHSRDEMKAAGAAVTVSVLQNVYAEEMVHYALPEAKVDQYESFDLMYQALNSGRSDAAATDMSSLQWFMIQNPGKYVDGGYGWNP